MPNNLPFPPGYIFGSGQGTLSRQHNFLAMPDWYQVPTGWYVMTDGQQNIWASPNADFSSPKYNAKIGQDGYLVFQDLLRSRREGVPSFNGSP